jgi:ATP-dependent Lon protease
LRIPPALVDRMEVIRLAGYTEDEKVQIARGYLISKQIKGHGLKKDEWSISDDALRDVIRYYTREAGVRNLEREIANLTRKATKEIVETGKAKIALTRRNLEKYAGVKRYRFGEVEEEHQIGVTTGLAWTEVGGELLSVEALLGPGKGVIKYTGKLGDVMQESIQAAWSYVRARSPDFGIKPTLFNKRDIHVHVPEGATPKDGPSAGVAMVTSIVSALTQIPIRKDLAMTGEISLRGRVLPIGAKDLAEIPDNVKKGLEIIPVRHVDEVLEKALTIQLVPIEWDEEQEALAKVAEQDAAAKLEDVVTH